MTLIFVTMGKIANAETNLLLDFQNQNQVSGSILQIYSNGTIKHRKKGCCPPKMNNVPEKKLTKAKLIELKKWISKAALGEITEKIGNSSTMGSYSGHAHAYSESGQKFVIRSITRSPDLNGYDKVLHNSSEEAQLIEHLIDKLVAHPLYK